MAIRIATRVALPRFEARTAESWPPERRQPASCAEAGAMVRVNLHCLSGDIQAMSQWCQPAYIGARQRLTGLPVAVCGVRFPRPFQTDLPEQG